MEKLLKHLINSSCPSDVGLKDGMNCERIRIVDIADCKECWIKAINQIEDD
ncbi:MAG: hypothetical protein ACOCZ5_00620 [bacterium]